MEENIREKIREIEEELDQLKIKKNVLEMEISVMLGKSLTPNELEGTKKKYSDYENIVRRINVLEKEKQQKYNCLTAELFHTSYNIEEETDSKTR